MCEPAQCGGLSTAATDRMTRMVQRHRWQDQDNEADSNAVELAMSGQCATVMRAFLAFRQLTRCWSMGANGG